MMEEIKHCPVVGCLNKSDQGTFIGEFCAPCYRAATNTNPDMCHSALYRHIKKHVVADVADAIVKKINAALEGE